MRQLARRYMEEHALPKKEPSTAEGDERMLRLHVLPRLGTRRVEDITRADVARLHHEMHHTPIQANRVVALLSKMFSLAELWGLREGNPARGIEKNPENRKERFLSDAELQRLGQTLMAAEADGSASRHAVAALRLLLLTGCRRGEILGLRWSDVDFDRGLLCLPDSKTGPRAVFLNEPAIEILQGLVEMGEVGEWVIEGEVQRSCRSD